MIKLLLDENLSYRLVKKLGAEFDSEIHVSRTGLSKPANDTAIWKWALNNDAIIVTNDEDFINLSVINGFPPKVILLKTGNQSTDFIFRILIRYKIEIEEFYSSPETGIVEIR